MSYTQSFFPTAVRLWNDFATELTESPSVKSFKHNYLKATPRPATNPLVYRGERRVAVSHSRMRIGCSSLNADLCRELHVLDSPACTCRSGDDETANHYLLHCENYRAERQIMLDSLAQLEHPAPNLELLLNRDQTKTLDHNTKVFKIIHRYIHTSKRFFN